MQKFLLLLSFALAFFIAGAQQSPIKNTDCSGCSGDSNSGKAITALTIEGDTLISLPGRKIRLNQQGFPEQIQTYFTPDMTAIGPAPNNLLAENIHFHFTRQPDGKDIRLKSGGLNYRLRGADAIQWEATSTSDELQMDVSAALESGGGLSYTVKVTALQDLSLKEITLHIPFQKELAGYMTGLGQKGGPRPDSMVRWKWDVRHKNEDGAWIGTVNAGLQYSLLSRASWDNEGNGGIVIGIKGKSMLANNYSGARTMKKGDILYYNFNLQITPFCRCKPRFMRKKACRWWLPVIK